MRRIGELCRKCDNSSICWYPLVDLEHNKGQEKVPFKAAVGSAEVKLTVPILTHDAMKHDSRFWMINISQLEKNDIIC